MSAKSFGFGILAGQRKIKRFRYLCDGKQTLVCCRIVQSSTIVRYTKQATMYLDDLKIHIESQLSTKDIESYDELFRYSKGAFPDVVFPIISNLKSVNSLNKKYYGLKELTSIIPESNPTNFDWRFDNTTIKKITSLIRRKKYKRIALFGTPSLFIPLSKISKDITLYDINELLRVHFKNDKRVIITDINTFDFKDIKLFDCVIMDPPWYLNYYKIWLQKGNSILKVNGEILITLFQEMLRPKAKKELTTIKTFAQKIGTLEIIEDYVTYITPLFEKELFNFKNIPCYGNWRIADLLIIKKETNNILPSIKNVKTDNWTRLEIGTQTIAIDGSKCIGQMIKVRFPYKNEDSLIKSVSERDSVRRKLNFITSRNRGLIITGCDKAIAILKSISNGVSKNIAFKENNLTKAEIVEVQKILNTIYI